MSLFPPTPKKIKTIARIIFTWLQYIEYFHLRLKYQTENIKTRDSWNWLRGKLTREPLIICPSGSFHVCITAWDHCNPAAWIRASSALCASALSLVASEFKRTNTCTSAHVKREAVLSVFRAVVNCRGSSSPADRYPSMTVMLINSCRMPP